MAADGWTAMTFCPAWNFSMLPRAPSPGPTELAYVLLRPRCCCCWNMASGGCNIAASEAGRYKDSGGGGGGVA